MWPRPRRQLNPTTHALTAGDVRMDRVMPSRVPQVSVADLPADATLLDVREDDEWAAGHVRDATHIPMGDVAARLDDVPEASDGSPLYVICRSGGRSARVTQFLNANGWEAVNVAGGMQSWASAGRPMVADGGGPARVI